MPEIDFIVSVYVFQFNRKFLFSLLFFCSDLSEGQNKSDRKKPESVACAPVDRDKVLRQLKFHLKRAQYSMKKIVY